MFLPLIFLLVIIITLLGTIVWSKKHICIGEDVKVAYPSTGDPQQNYYFGTDISVSGNTLVVGVPGSPQSGTGTANGSGVVYVYENGNYITPPVKVADPVEGPPQSGYQFGSAVDISGDTLVVGAYRSPQDGTSTANDSGCVYVYKNGNYTSTPVKAGNPSSGAPQNLYKFGWSVAISADTLVVGATGSPQSGTGVKDDSGCVYVYKNGNYASTPVKAGNPSTGTPRTGYLFGYKVAISGNTLVVSAIGANQDGTSAANYSGCVYIYENGNYTSTPVKAGNPSTGAPLPGYQFGTDIAISGNTLVIGVEGAAINGTDPWDNSGAVYVYKNGNYTSTPVKVAYPSTGPPEQNYRFGASVAISGNTLVVSAYGSPQSGTGTANSSGCVYVYKNGNYTSAPVKVEYVGDYIPLSGYLFGYSVCTNGEAVAIGAIGQPADDISEANNAGAVYMYPCIGEY